MNVFDTVIVGGGPADTPRRCTAPVPGLSAAVLETLYAGGQMAATNRIENYPGFDEVDGFSLAQRMKEGAERAGAVSYNTEVLELYLTETPKRIVTSSGEFSAHHGHSRHGRTAPPPRGRARSGIHRARARLLRHVRRHVLPRQDRRRRGRRELGRRGGSVPFAHLPNGVCCAPAGCPARRPRRVSAHSNRPKTCTFSTSAGWRNCSARRRSPA